MANLFTRLIPLLPGCKKEQLSTKHRTMVKIQNRQKNNFMEWIALMLLVAFFACLGVASAGVPRMWTISKVFFVAGLLLFIIGNRKKGKDLTSGKRWTDQECVQLETEPDIVNPETFLIGSASEWRQGS
jgi:hypothetical protein